jgi:hypothetical protein
MIYQASTWVLPVVFAVTFHEAAHGFVAVLAMTARGRPRARNPLKPRRIRSARHPSGDAHSAALTTLCSAMKPVPVNSGVKSPDATWWERHLPEHQCAGYHLVAAVLWVGLMPGAGSWLAEGGSGPDQRVLCVFNMFASARRRKGGGRAVAGCLFPAGATRALRHIYPAVLLLIPMSRQSGLAYHPHLAGQLPSRG